MDVITAAIFLAGVRFHQEHLPQLLEFWRRHGGTEPEFWELRLLNVDRALAQLALHQQLSYTELTKTFYRTFILQSRQGLIALLLEEGSVSQEAWEAELVISHLKVES